MNTNRGTPKVLLIGEHDKGIGQPFSPMTISGRRLRGLIDQLSLPAVLINMMRPDQTRPSRKQIDLLVRKQRRSGATVFLGRKVERELRDHIPQGVYLPHPASRARAHREHLKRGLREILEQSL
jgi:hypothetical protein